MMTELLKVQVEHNCQAYAQEALNSHTLWSQEVNKGCWDMDAFVCQVAAADGALCDVFVQIAKHTLLYCCHTSFNRL